MMPAASGPALAVRDLRVSARDEVLVRDLGFSLQPGENLTVLGESGAGKSLLLQTVMGTLPAGLAAQGMVCVLGAESAAASRARTRLWGHGLTLLPQEPWLALDPTMPIIEQVAEGARGKGRRARRGAARIALERLGLAAHGEKYPFMLSGGMAQRAGFAAATMPGPRVLLVDEPTKGLDAAMRGQVLAQLRDVLAAGTTLLTVTHDVALADALGGEVLVMHAGEVVERGAAGSVLARPQHPRTVALVSAVPARWPRAPAPPSRGTALLGARGLAKRYGQRELFSGLDLAITRGGRVALTGPSGAGKTTLGNILIGLVAPSAGTVHRAPGLHSTAMQKLYQEPPAAFVPHATLATSLADLIALHKLDGARIPAMMDRLGLAEPLLARRPDAVSGGELQRFALLRVLLLQPALIMADEPTSRLDPVTQKQTLDLLVSEAAEREIALLLITHDSQIARALAAQVVAVG